MPVETAIVVTAIVGVFVFFGAMVAFADLTWQGKAKR